jgi:hypothetical protein
MFTYICRWILTILGQSRPKSYGSWIDIYLYNQCLLPPPPFIVLDKLYLIKFFNDLWWQVSGFLWMLHVLQPNLNWLWRILTLKLFFFYSFAFKSMYVTQLDQLFGKWFCNNSIVKCMCKFKTSYNYYVTNHYILFLVTDLSWKIKLNVSLVFYVDNVWGKMTAAIITII